MYIQIISYYENFSHHTDSLMATIGMNQLIQKVAIFCRNTCILASKKNAISTAKINYVDKMVLRTTKHKGKFKINI